MYGATHAKQSIQIPTQPSPTFNPLPITSIKLSDSFLDTLNPFFRLGGRSRQEKGVKEREIKNLGIKIVYEMIIISAT